MKTLIIALLLNLTALYVSAQPVFTNTATADFQSVQSQFTMDFTNTGYQFPFSVQMYAKTDTNMYNGFQANTALSNQWNDWNDICVGEADSVAIFWKVTHTQSGDVWYSDTTTVTMPTVQNENPFSGVLAGRIDYLNAICPGSRGISSVTVNVGDSIRIQSLIFREYDVTSHIDSIIVWIGNNRLAQTSFVGPASSPNTWLHVMQVNSNLIIGTGDTVRTEIQVSASASPWEQGMQVDQSVQLLPVEAGDQSAYYNFCADMFPTRYGCNGGGGPATVTISSPDTLMLGDSMCVSVTTDMPIILSSQGFSWNLPTGTTTVCLPPSECSGDNYFWFNWENTNGWVGNANFIVYFTVPYTATVTTVGATNASISVTAPTIVMARLYDWSFTIVDSTTIGTGTWSIGGLTPSSSYYIWISFMGGNPSHPVTDCYSAASFTTSSCVQAVITRMVVTNNGNDLEITLEFPHFGVGSIMLINGSPITLVQTGISGQMSTMTLTIPYSNSVTVAFPCGGSDTYNTLTTSIDKPQTIVQGLVVTSESISTDNQELLINLYDLTGKVVATGKGNVITTGVSPGVYVYIIMNPKGEVVKKDKYVKL